MTRRAEALLAALAFTLLAAPALAQAPPPTLTPGAAAPGPHPPREGRRPPVQLFISPAGEPFRTADGLGAWLAQADADHDGVVTAAEFRADALRFFKVLDANGDGVIDGFEVQAYENEIVPEIRHIGLDDGPPAAAGPRRGGGGSHGRGGGMGRGGMGRGGGGGMGGGGGRHSGGDAASGAAADVSATTDRLPPAGREGASRFSLINQPEPVLAADVNIDGKVTLDEWIKATTHRFELLDKGKTGKLSRASLTAPRPDGK